MEREFTASCKFQGKPASLAQAGADFTQKDLRTLVSLSPTLDRFLKLCHVE